jgi:2,3,4,5-tetrahydropyridine-2,6-dicarboxylate N-succinyltransferase
MSTAHPTPRGEALLVALERGEVRAATRDEGGAWTVHPWVKEGILELFRGSPIVPMGLEQHPAAADAAFRDKASFPVRRFTEVDRVRMVPGGSAVRRGAHLGADVVCMPPMYVNVGAFVGSGTMIDSHALVGSCAQIGRDVHLSAAAQIGGVLEPASARPVIVEDGAFIGGNCGVYEGVLVRARAVLAAGVILTAATRVYDLVHGRELCGTRQAPLEIPAGAVVVPGTRQLQGDFAARHGLSAACALIVKYRDGRTDERTALEEALRG